MDDSLDNPCALGKIKHPIFFLYKVDILHIYRGYNLCDIQENVASRWEARHLSVEE